MVYGYVVCELRKNNAGERYSDEEGEKIGRARNMTRAARGTMSGLHHMGCGTSKRTSKSSLPRLFKCQHVPASALGETEVQDIRPSCFLGLRENIRRIRRTRGRGRDTGRGEKRKERGKGTFS